MMRINIYQAKTQLSKLIEQSLHGEEVIISKAGKPLVKLVPCTPTSQPRQPGAWRGKIKISDDFDESDSMIQRLFEGD